MSFSGNDYTRYLSQQQQSPHTSVSEGNTSAVNGTRRSSAQQMPTDLNSNHPDGSAPQPQNHSPQPSVNHSNPLTARLNDMTLEELLESPGRASLPRLDPNRPPGTFWFDDDTSVAATVRSIFERDFKEPHTLIARDFVRRKICEGITTVNHLRDAFCEELLFLANLSRLTICEGLPTKSSVASRLFSCSDICVTVIDTTKNDVCSTPCTIRYGTFECFHDCILDNFRDGNCINGRCCCK